MPQFTLTAHIIRPADTAMSRVTDLLIAETSTLYSTTRFDGQITAWDIAGPAPSPIATSGFASGLIAGQQPGLAMVTTDTGLALFSGGGVAGGVSLRGLTGDGSFLATTELASGLTAPLLQPVSIAHQTGTTSIYGALIGQSGLVQVDLSGAGHVTEVIRHPDAGHAAAGDITALTGAAVGDTSFLIGASTQDAGITAWEVSETGDLRETDTLRAEDSLRLATPTALESLSVGGKTYVIAAGATSDSLTVLGLDATGALQITDHVMDDRTTRFDGVTALATTIHNGTAWVFAGGADDGISAFQLLDGGRLLHRGQIADTVDSALANISALAVRSETDGIAVFATSATEAGLTALTLEVDPADQAIPDTAGSDVLTGGAGADVFVFTADRVTDTITDFTLGTDRVDLSAWDGLRSKNQLVFEETADGLRITYGDEILHLHSADGQAITAEALLETDLIGQSSLALTLAAGHAGPVTAAPALPARYIPAAGTPAPDAPPDRVEAYGTGAADDILGGLGGDLLFGQFGDDHLQGDAGNDLLFGGPGRDRLEGGHDDDQLFGGEGRDMGWLTPDRPAENRNGDVLGGGAGDDRLYGQAGRDRLDGGAGDDLLVGGAGRDTFVFRSGHDTIADFDPLIDTVVLNAALWGSADDAAAVITQFQIMDGPDLVLQFDADHSLRLTEFDDATGLADQIIFL